MKLLPGLVLFALSLVGQVSFIPPGSSGGGGGSVTSITTSCGATGGTITTTGNIATLTTINSQTGSAPYAIQNADCGKLIARNQASAVLDTIAQAGTGGNFAAGWYIKYQCSGVGGCTITPTVSTIDGGTSVVLTQNQGIQIATDGTNYFTLRGGAGGGVTIPSVTNLLAGNGSGGVSDSTIAPSAVVKNGVDINSSNQVTAQHFAAALPENVGGTGANNTVGAAGHVLRSNATHYVDSAIQVGDVPTLNQNTSGNAGTATALAANGTNCSAGNFPLGVDASGNSETCTKAPQAFFGTAAPGSVAGNLPGDVFSDTTNHNVYQCNATSGTAAPACTSVTAGGWTLLNVAGSGCTVGGSQGDLQQNNGSSGCSASNVHQDTSTGQVVVSKSENGPAPSPIAFSATPTFDLSTCNRCEMGAMTANVTSITFTNPKAGLKFSLTFLQDGTGERTITGYAISGGSVTNTCPVSPTASIRTTQLFEIASDGLTVRGIGCSTDDTSTVWYGPTRSAPGTPASGLVVWFDSTDNDLEAKDSSGNIYKGLKAGVDVNPATGQLSITTTTCSSQVVTAISARGVGTCAAVTLGSLATQAADTVDMNASGSIAVPTAVALPTSGTNGCAGATNGLIYNTSTHAFGCNTNNVVNNAANTGGASMTLDMSGATGVNAVRDPNIAGYVPSAAGAHGYDTTNKNEHWFLNGVDNIMVPVPVSVTITDGDCAQWSKSSNVITLKDIACGTGGAGTSVTNVTPVTVNTNTTSDQQLMELSFGAGYFNSSKQPFLFNGAGVYTTQTAQTPTITLKVKLCTVSGCGSGTVVTLVSIVSTATTAAITNNNWNLSVLGYTATTGATGNLEIHGPLAVDLGALTTTADAIFVDTNTAVSSNIDLTAALFVDFTVTFSTNAATANVFTQRSGGVMPFAATAAPVTSVGGQTGAVSGQGTGAKAQMATGSTTTGDLLDYDASGTAIDSSVLAANVVTAASNATATAKTCVSAGSNKTCSYIDFPERFMVPAANCNNTTVGLGWSIGSGGTGTCRAGTNNLGGFVSITDTSSTFAQFMVSLPVDWDTSTRPYILLAFESATDTTNGHTVIPEVAISCSTAVNGTTTDDITLSAYQSLTTVTFGASAVAHGFYTTSVQLGSTQMSGCVAGGMMIVSVGRATDTATGVIGFYYANITFPRLIAVQAN